MDTYAQYLFLHECNCMSPVDTQKAAQCASHKYKGWKNSRIFAIANVIQYGESAIPTANYCTLGCYTYLLRAKFSSFNFVEKFRNDRFLADFFIHWPTPGLYIIFVAKVQSNRTQI